MRIEQAAKMLANETNPRAAEILLAGQTFPRVPFQRDHQTGYVSIAKLPQARSTSWDATLKSARAAAVN